MSVIVNWAQRAWNYFWNHGGTQQEQVRQEGLVDSFGQTINAASAEITAPGHAGGNDPNEPWHITARYFDGGGTQIHSPHGGAWHVY